VKRIPIALSALSLLALAPSHPDGLGQGRANLQVRTLDGELVSLSQPRLVQEKDKPQRLEGNHKGKAWSADLAALWQVGYERGAAADFARDKAKSFFQLRGSSSLEGKLVGGDSADPKWFRFKLPGAKEGLVLRHHLLALRLQPVRKPVPKDPTAAVINAKNKRTTGKTSQAKKGEEANALGPKLDRDGGFAKALANPPENRDLIFVEDKKKRIRSFACDVRGVDDKGVSIEFRGQTRSLPLARVYGIVFGTLSGLAPEFLAPGQVTVELSLSDNRRFRGSLKSLDKTSWTLTLAEKIETRFPTAWIRNAMVFSDRCVYVSDLEIKDRIQKPMLGREWPILQNHSGGGVSLSLGGQSYRKGFLLVPDVSFRVDFPRAYSRLIGQVGMPKSMVGAAVLRFLVDGNQIGPDYKLQANGKLQDIDLDLQGAKELSLELEHSADLDAGARVILGDLRAINTQ